MKLKSAVYLGLMPLCAVMLAVAGCKKKTEPAPEAPQKAVSSPVFDAAPMSAPAPAAALPEVLVEVDGEKFTSQMANAEVDQRLASIKAQIPPDRVQELKLRLIDQLVERFVVKTLLAAEIKKANITAASEEVDQRMEKLKTSIPKGATFEDILKNNGITEAKVREDVASDIKITKLFAPITNAIAVTDAEVAEYSEKNKEAIAFPETVHARHILVATAKTDDDKAKAEKKSKADKLKEQLDKGADFATLAKENSDCPSKEMGGDLGKFQKGRMTKAFEDAAFAQATNVIGSVVETEFGYHIVQVLEHQAAGSASKEEISKAILNQKYDDALRKYVASLAQKANIKNNLPQRMAMPPMGMPPTAPAQAPAAAQTPAPAPAPTQAPAPAPAPGL